MSGGGERLLLLRHVAAVERLALSFRLAWRPRRPAPAPGQPVRVVLLPSSPASDVGMHHRIHAWKPHLERKGFEMRVLDPCTEEEWAAFSGEGFARDQAYHRGTLRAAGVNLREALDADVVVLHRAVLPFSPYRRPTLELLLAKKNPRLVYDFFDSIWERSRRAHEVARGAVARRLNPPDFVERVVRASAAVTVSSQYLGEFVRPLGTPVTVVPMLLDPGPYTPRVHAERSPVVLGWMGNTGNLDRLRSILPGLRRAATRRRLLLRCVSGAPFEAEGLDVESLTHPWSPESERRDLASFDIGLLPMFDQPYDRGKFPFKLLQYAAAGLPIVAPPVAIDPAIWKHGESILFASTEGEWAAAVESLAADPRRRAALGAAARVVVERHFTHAAWADRFARLLSTVAGEGVPVKAGKSA